MTDLNDRLAAQGDQPDPLDLVWERDWPAPRHAANCGVWIMADPRCSCGADQEWRDEQPEPTTAQLLDGLFGGAEVPLDDTREAS